MADVLNTTTVNTNVATEHDDAKHRAQRRHYAQATAATRATNQRHYDRNQSEFNTTLFGSEAPTTVAPKWRRHQEDYINPHLLPHERDPIAPRYGPDSVCKRLRPTDERVYCSCSYCVPALHKRGEEKRQANVALKRIVLNNPGYGRAQMAGASRGPWADWDWNGHDDPRSYDGDDDWRLDYQTDKRAPQATVDLLSIAKPAKGKKRTAQNTNAASARRATNLAIARSFLEPVASGSGALPDIDEISILDFEETWEHLDLERLNLGIDDERGSEWQWERFSEFSHPN
ncbi:hypothetical protein M408DRAFT_8859 [Serendipita vermifera MAFF 305830]|uniref:Uncharacterized protein n=1 Tax=Serendipita vermifera MAFF 305830 TaxID=933852 RepID=A0A0C2XGD3_SERVB|nr:hypothetical protein M408DRAFT_8859 [Serendipita vermifera MAFF 305830]